MPLSPPVLPERIGTGRRQAGRPESRSPAEPDGPCSLPGAYWACSICRICAILNTGRTGPWWRPAFPSADFVGTAADLLPLITDTDRRSQKDFGGESLVSPSVIRIRTRDYSVSGRDLDVDRERAPLPTGSSGSISTSRLFLVCSYSQRPARLSIRSQLITDGIFYGMKSEPPTSDEVFEDLGEKVLDGLAAGVAYTSDDLAEYRRIKADWVAQHSERGLANWIHDRLWHHLASILDGLPNVIFTEQGPTREISVGLNYKLRVKRHRDEGDVASYDTQGALEFYGQAQLSLDGMKRLNLIAGYRWDPELHSIGAPVLSLRYEKHDPVWMEEIPTSSIASGAATLPSTGPTPPRVEGPAGADDFSGEEAGPS